MSTECMAATSQPVATATALSVLREGGNAMDAAIAAGAVLCVTEPQSTGIGGDCFILYYHAASAQLYGLNGSGAAPVAATVGEYRRRGLTQVPEQGVLSLTVPGAVDAWASAVERFGSRDLAGLLGPAIGLAEDGFAVTPVVAKVWAQHSDLLSSVDTTRAVFLPEGTPPSAGRRWRFPALARSLREIADGGPRAFYEGRLAREIVAYVQGQGGLLSEEDLAAHQGEWVEPISTRYGGLDVYEIPPNGQGITALITLNMLAASGIGNLQHLGPDHVHFLSEAFRLARADRDAWVADTRGGAVPVEALLDAAYARERRSLIDMERASAQRPVSGLVSGRDTVYLSVVDRDRNCCSFINSLYYPHGSGHVAGDTGIMLQNRGAGFVLDEDHPNCLRPGRRPLHTIIPAMACRDGRPELCFGVMGGEYQAMGHCYVLTNVLDFGLDLQEAVDAARFLPAGRTLTVESGVPGETCRELERRGHRIEVLDQPMGGAQIIRVDHAEGVLQGASDPRKDGCALGC